MSLKKKRKKNFSVLASITPVSLSAPVFSLSQQFLLAPVAHEQVVANANEFWLSKVTIGTVDVIKA